MKVRVNVAGRSDSCEEEKSYKAIHHRKSYGNTKDSMTKKEGGMSRDQSAGMRECPSGKGSSEGQRRAQGDGDV